MSREYDMSIVDERLDSKQNTPTNVHHLKGARIGGPFGVGSNSHTVEIPLFVGPDSGVACDFIE